MLLEQLAMAGEDCGTDSELCTSATTLLTNQNGEAPASGEILQKLFTLGTRITFQWACNKRYIIGRFSLE